MELQKKFTALAQSQVELEVVVAREDAQRHYQRFVEEYLERARLPGFRKGKVPLAVLERKYGSAIRQDAAASLMEKALEEGFAQASQDSQPLPISRPSLKKKPVFDPDEDFSFAVIYDVFPSVELRNTSGFSLSVPTVSVTEEDVSRELTRIQERNALVTDKGADSCAEVGDIATVDYHEVDDSGAVRPGTERAGVVFTLGVEEGPFALGQDILGMKLGQRCLFAKRAGMLKDEAAQVRVTLKALKQRQLPSLDDELAQDVSDAFRTLDDLKRSVRQNLAEALEAALHEYKRRQLLRILVRENPFSLPESLVVGEMESRWALVMRQFGVSLSGTPQNKLQFFQQWRPEVEEHLKQRVIVELLLKQEQVSVSAEEIETEYVRIASKTGSKEERVREYYAGEEKQRALCEGIRERKLCQKLLGRCVTECGPEQSLTDFLQEQSRA